MPLDRYLGSDVYVEMYKVIEANRAAIDYRPKFNPENPPRDVMDKGVHRARLFGADVLL